MVILARLATKSGVSLAGDGIGLYGRVVEKSTYR